MSKTKRKKSDEELLSEVILTGTLTNEFGEAAKVLVTLDDGDKRIISKAAEKKRREQAKRFFQQKSKDERGEYIQLIHSSNDQLHEKNALVSHVKERWTLLHDKYTMLLVPYADIASKGMLVSPTTKLPMNGAEIARELKASIKNVNPMLKALVTHNVLIPHKAAGNQKHFQFNDDVFNINGRKLKQDEFFTKVFQRSLSQIMQKLSGNEIGLLRVMASKFHYQSCFLVENPNEDLRKDTTLSFQENFEEYGTRLFSKLKFLRLSDLMKLADIQHPNTLLDYLELLQDSGAILINEQSNGQRGKKRRVKRRIRVHPSLMFREQGGLNERYLKYMGIDFDVMEFDGGEDEM